MKTRTPIIICIHILVSFHLSEVIIRGETVGLNFLKRTMNLSQED